MTDAISGTQQSTREFNPFRLNDLLPAEYSRGRGRVLLKATEKLPGLDYLARIYPEVRDVETPADFANNIFRYLYIEIMCDQPGLTSIPEKDR